LCASKPVRREKRARLGHQLGEHSTRMRPSPAIGRSDRNHYPVKSSNQRGGPLFALIAVNERWRNPLPKSADFSLHHAQQVPRRASSVLCMREYTPLEVRRQSRYRLRNVSRASRRTSMRLQLTGCIALPCSARRVLVNSSAAVPRRYSTWPDHARDRIDPIHLWARACLDARPPALAGHTPG
jgi:hypothetical protein